MHYLILKIGALNRWKYKSLLILFVSFLPLLTIFSLSVKNVTLQKNLDAENLKNDSLIIVKQRLERKLEYLTQKSQDETQIYSAK